MKYEWFGEEETDDSVRKKNSLSSVVDLRMSSTGQRPLVTMYILARISLQYDVEPNSHQRLCQSLSKLFVLLFRSPMHGSLLIVNKMFHILRIRINIQEIAELS